MPSIDDILQADAKGWQDALPPTITGESDTAPDWMTLARTARSHRRRSGALAISAAATIVTGLIAAGIVVVTTDSSQPAPRRSGSTEPSPSSAVSSPSLSSEVSLPDFPPAPIGLCPGLTLSLRAGSTHLTEKSSALDRKTIEVDSDATELEVDLAGPCAGDAGFDVDLYGPLLNGDPGTASNNPGQRRYIWKLRTSGSAILRPTVFPCADVDGECNAGELPVSFTEITKD